MHMCSQIAQMVKNLPTMPETWVQSLGWEDPLEKGMATHSSILAWRIPWTEEPGGLRSMGSWRVGYNWMTNTFTFLYVFLSLSIFSTYSFFLPVCLSIHPSISKQPTSMGRIDFHKGIDLSPSLTLLWDHSQSSLSLESLWLPMLKESPYIFLSWSYSYRFPNGSEGKESACNAGDTGSIPESGRSPGGGNGNPLQYSCLGNPMDRGAWWASVRGVAKSQSMHAPYSHGTLPGPWGLGCSATQTFGVCL